MNRIISTVIILLFSVAHASATPSNLDNWTRYFGSSYIAPPWGNTMRGVGRGKVGLTEQFDPRIESDLQKFAKTHDVIVGVSLPVDQNFGPSYTGSETEKMKKWRDNLSRDAKKIINSPSIAGGVYWQIGNEINIRHFGRRVCSWVGECTVNKHNDISVIPSLVENYLAPAVETLRSISKDHQRNQIILGSMAAFFRVDSMKFLEELLNYRINGDHAESLRGKKVYEIIDIAAIHYLVTWGDGSLPRARNDSYDEELGNLQYQDGNIWLQELDNLHAKWVATGKLRGIWATEEIGKSKANENLGAATAIKVTARYMYWWARHGISSEQSRCIFWGTAKGASGTTADEGMQALNGLFGDSAIQLLDGAATIEASGEHELYLFQPLNDYSSRVAILFPKSSQDILIAKGVILKALGWRGNARATLHLFSANGHDEVTVPVLQEGDTYKINFPSVYTFENQAVAVILLRQEPSTKQDP